MPFGELGWCHSGIQRSLNGKSKTWMLDGSQAPVTSTVEGVIKVVDTSPCLPILLMQVGKGHSCSFLLNIRWIRCSAPSIEIARIHVCAACSDRQSYYSISSKILLSSKKNQSDPKRTNIKKTNTTTRINYQSYTTTIIILISYITRNIICNCRVAYGFNMAQLDG